MKWLVGGIEKATGATYTVAALDAGQSITVSVTGTGSYTGTVTSRATGVVSAATTAESIYTLDPDDSPVVLDPTTTFVGEDNNPIELTDDTTLVTTVARSDAEVPQDDSDRITAQFNTQVTASGVEVTADHVTVSAVDVELTAVSGDEETVVHPVGDTTVTLSKEALGLSADADLDLYVFAASHTNAADAVQAVPGTVVTVDGVQYVRFVLNVLSTKLVNTGTITGNGTISLLLGDDISDYDNGIAYVEMENDSQYDPETGITVYHRGEYSRYKFVRDPAESMDVVFYVAELLNDQGGTCTITLETQPLPAGDLALRKTEYSSNTHVPGSF